MPERRARLVQARQAVGLTQEDVAHRVGVDRSTVGRWETGDTVPQPWARRNLADLLGVTLPRLDDLLAPGGPAEPEPVGDEMEALELARRAAASDVGDTTLAQLEQAVDDLASSYATTDPAALLDRTRTHLRYVGQLVDARKTLREHRRLLVSGGWLSLLGATLHVDLQQQGPAAARMRTADSLAREGGHDEIRAWCLETNAWQLLTLGEYQDAARLAVGAQQLAPAGTSALVQAMAQEGRAWARLGDTRATTQAVGRVNRMARPRLPVRAEPAHYERRTGSSYVHRDVDPHGPGRRAAHLERVRSAAVWSATTWDTSSPRRRAASASTRKAATSRNERWFESATSCAARSTSRTPAGSAGSPLPTRPSRANRARSDGSPRSRGGPRLLGAS